MSSSSLCTKSKINFSSPNFTAEMKEEVESLPEASFSSVLTIAKHLLAHMESLAPPNLKAPEINSEIVSGSIAEE